MMIDSTINETTESAWDTDLSLQTMGMIDGAYETIYGETAWPYFEIWAEPVQAETVGTKNSLG